jgi:hypothetical protein
MASKNKKEKDTRITKNQYRHGTEAAKAFKEAMTALFRAPKRVKKGKD